VSTIWFTGAVLLGTLLLGFATTSIRARVVGRWAAWLVVIGGVVGVERLSSEEPAAWRMLVISGVLLWGMKAVVSVECLAARQARLKPLRWFAFAILWFGMRPSIFAAARRSARPEAFPLIARGINRLVQGGTLVLAAKLLCRQSPSWLPESVLRILVTVLALSGLSLILHFGIFNLVAGAWRLLGFDCRPLFRAPLNSKSLTEFWAHRWNLAFSEMTAIAIYRPLAAWLGRGPALWGAFLFSGLLHELAISVPVKAGFGLPLLYFALHGVLVQIERWLEKAKRPILELGWLGRVWTLGWLALPLPLLFHPAFVHGVVWPILGIEP
jgi:alginate O-acetyltransferase complex protein AlgI